MVALATALELLNLLQLSLNVGVAVTGIFQQNVDIFRVALIEQARDLTSVELAKIQANNKKIRDDFLNLGGEPE